MRDAGYVAAGYTATFAALAGYRWLLAARTRRARRYVTAVTGRAHGRGPRDEVTGAAGQRGAPGGRFPGSARWRRQP
jgi:hypothetical protein